MRKAKTPPTLFSTLGPLAASVEAAGVLVKPEIEKHKSNIDITLPPKQVVKQFIIRWSKKQHFEIKALAADSQLKSMQLLVQLALDEYRIQLEKDSAEGVLTQSVEVAKAHAGTSDVLGDDPEIKQFIIRWSEEQHYSVKALAAQLKMKSMQQYVQQALECYKRNHHLR